MQLVNVSQPQLNGSRTQRPRTGHQLRFKLMCSRAETESSALSCCCWRFKKEKKKKREKKQEKNPNNNPELLHPRHTDVTLHWCARGSMSVWNCCSVQNRRPNVQAAHGTRLVRLLASVVEKSKHPFAPNYWRNMAVITGFDLCSSWLIRWVTVTSGLTNREEKGSFLLLQLRQK